jgi:NAD(P)-dependent dehydrogenase (short-subunit alcohol dehydrogenase family)
VKDFRGKTAVVTGAASGMGLALAHRFAAEDANVVLADVETVALDAAVIELTALGHNAIGIVCDVTQRDDVFALADQARQHFGAIQVICNNAGVESGSRFSNVPQSTWDWVMGVNFYGVLYGCQAFLPLLREAGEGHIVNTGSMASLQGTQPTASPYIAAKHAVLGLSESIYHELKRAGEPIGVSVLLPGLVRTNMAYSERNRPHGVPDTATDPEREEQRRWAIEGTAQGKEPAFVADLVLDAIRTDRFFVPTHPDLALAATERRMRWLERDADTPVHTLEPEPVHLPAVSAPVNH